MGLGAKGQNCHQILLDTVIDHPRALPLDLNLEPGACIRQPTLRCGLAGLNLLHNLSMQSLDHVEAIAFGRPSFGMAMITGALGKSLQSRHPTDR